VALGFSLGKEDGEQDMEGSKKKKTAFFTFYFFNKGASKTMN
jgi:hypothetical protein